MGAFTPRARAHALSRDEDDSFVRRILVPTMSGLVHEARPYVGLLYIGLMLTGTAAPRCWSTTSASATPSARRSCCS